MIFEQKDFDKILKQMSKLEVASANIKSNYINNNKKRVPRVTEVLSAMLHEEGLMNWSNSLGWKRISYRSFMATAADKGTFSHMAIENYIKTGKFDINEYGILDMRIKDVVCSVMDGFIKWWNELHTKFKNVDIIYIEETMIHDYFGGTCDCLLKLDDKYWLIDFKTSNHMNYNYALQLSAYRFLLRELKGINIDGCSILILDKENHSYKEFPLDLSKEENIEFMNNCEQTFLTLVTAFKMRMYTNEQYYQIYGVERWNKK